MKTFDTHRCNRIRGLFSLAAMLILPACVKVHVDPLEVKPITLNVNVNYVDQKLDDLFAYQQQQEQNASTQPGAATQPAAK